MIKDSLAEELIDLMIAERSVYIDIMEIAKNKKSIIVDGRVEELEKLVKLEQSLLMSVGKIEAERSKVLHEIGKLTGKDDISVSQIIKIIDSEKGARLSAVSKSIIEIIDELKDKNDVNSKLLKNSLEFIDFSINILSSFNDDGRYENTGKTGAAKSRNFFDVKL